MYEASQKLPEEIELQATITFSLGLERTCEVQDRLYLKFGRKLGGQRHSFLRGMRHWGYLFSGLKTLLWKFNHINSFFSSLFLPESFLKQLIHFCEMSVTFGHATEKQKSCVADKCLSPHPQCPFFSSSCLTELWFSLGQKRDQTRKTKQKINYTSQPTSLHKGAARWLSYDQWDRSRNHCVEILRNVLFKGGSVDKQHLLFPVLSSGNADLMPGAPGVISFVVLYTEDDTTDKNGRV